MKNYAFHAIPGLIVLTLLLIVTMTWFQSESLESAYSKIFQHNMETRAKMVRLVLESSTREENTVKVAERALRMAKVSESRITIITEQGKVIVDTDLDPALMPNHSTRPEVVDALQKGSGSSRRFSEATRQEIIYVALKSKGADGKTYVTRIGMPMHSVNSMVMYARRDIIFLTISIILIMIGAGFFLRRWIKTPVDALASQSNPVIVGQPDFRFNIKSGPSYVRNLTDRLNELLVARRDQIERLRLEKSKRDVIFSSMSEGVIAANRHGIIIDINQEAAKILDQPTLTEGCSLKSLVRGGGELHDFAMRLLEESQPLMEDLTIDGDSPRYIRLRGTLMKSEHAETSGVVLVISDMTRLYKLENFRRDFIADVSHEIKTPLTVISGAVEALQSGADSDPEEAARFMNMIVLQSERLNNLVRDILNISALEHRAEGDVSEFIPVSLVSVTRNAIELVSERAARQNIQTDFRHPDEAYVNGDPQLLEQAVFNLVDNAVKYSGCTRIEVIITIEKPTVILQISDNGCGIGREHLVRLFERFYRVDKNRSRKLGGTGLGLSIVKHTVQYHHGAVSVESSPGKGCIFTIRLPMATDIKG